MSIFKISDVVTLSMIIAVAIVFTAIWMVISERRRNILKTEIKKLKSQEESYEREKFILLEKINILENTQILPGQNEWTNDSQELERALQEAREKLSVVQVENDRLKKELSEARGSLEEVYKALG